MRKVIAILVLLSGVNKGTAQNIGIGVSNPTRAKLEVFGSPGAGTTSALFGGTSTGVSIQHHWPSIGFNQFYNGPGEARYIGNGFAAVQYLDPNFGGLFFDLYENSFANNVANPPKRALSIFQSGNLAIGPSYTNASLSVSRYPTVDATAYLFGTTHHSAFNFGIDQHTYLRAGKDNGMVIINDIPGGKVAMSGFVGINTLTPSGTLEIRQKDDKGLILVNPEHFYNWEMQAGTGALYGNLHFIYNGDLKSFIKATDGGLSTISDSRLKKNIRNMPSLMEKIMQLNPVEYEMIHNNPGNERSLGFIAQDVNKLFPQLVHIVKNASPSYKEISDLYTVDYNGFSVLAIKAIQEQQKMINTLEAEIEELKRMMGGFRR